jgi:hypothetical protein
MGLHISDIRELYEKGHYTYKYNITDVNIKRLPEDYVFDEDLSVRRNRELVAEHNKKIDDYHKNKRERQAELDKKLTNDVVEYIKEYYELTDKQARIVESWVYREKHAFMCDYFSYIDTFAEFADDLINYAD